MAVYVVLAEGTSRYKIGYAENVDNRIKYLKTGCPFPIEVVSVFDEGTAEDERSIHEVFKDYRVHGEWFCLPEQIVTWIRDGNLPKYTKIVAAQFLLSKDLSYILPESKVDEIRSTMKGVINGIGF